MTRITVFGGTGYAGSAIVAEAARRGHEVTSVSRSVPEQQVEGVRYETGSVLDADVRAREDGRRFVVLPGDGEPMRVLELAEVADRLQLEE